MQCLQHAGVKCLPPIGGRNAPRPMREPPSRRGTPMALARLAGSAQGSVSHASRFDHEGRVSPHSIDVPRAVCVLLAHETRTAPALGLYFELRFGNLAMVLQEVRPSDMNYTHQDVLYWQLYQQQMQQALQHYHPGK